MEKKYFITLNHRNSIKFLLLIHQYTWVSITTLFRIQRNEMYWFYCRQSSKKHCYFVLTHQQMTANNVYVSSVDVCLPKKRGTISKKKKCIVCVRHIIFVLSANDQYSIYSNKSESSFIFFLFRFFGFFVRFVFFICVRFSKREMKQIKKRDQK